MEPSPQTAYIASTPCLGCSGDLRAYIGDAYWHTGSFRTLKAFRRFVRRFGLHLTPLGSYAGASGVEVERHAVRETFSSHFFWRCSDLPEGARRFRALSNGSIVWCFWKRTGDHIDIYRPNPNAKAVYRPLSLQRHIAFSRRNGIY